MLTVLIAVVMVYIFIRFISLFCDIEESLQFPVTHRSPEEFNGQLFNELLILLMWVVVLQVFIVGVVKLVSWRPTVIIGASHVSRNEVQ